LLRVKGLARDISRRKRAEEHQSRLMAELDHRVKNMLARLSAVAMFTRGGKSTMDEFLLALDDPVLSGCPGPTKRQSLAGCQSRRSGSPSACAVHGREQHNHWWPRH
jgi:hypothetical protein